MDKIKSFLNQISPLSQEAFQLMSACFSKRAYKKNEYFVKDGQYVHQFGILEEGITRGFYRSDDGVEYNKAMNQAISLIGPYTALITHGVNKINVQCLTDCSIWVAKYQELDQLCYDIPEIERLSRKMLEQLYVKKEKRELEMALKNSTERYEIFKSEYPGVEGRIAQYHIASYLGITPIQLSRVRRALTNK